MTVMVGNSKKSADKLAENYSKIVLAKEELENKISEKLLTLCIKYPEVPVVITCLASGACYRAKSMANKFYIETLPVKTRVDYIRIIENYISSDNFKQSSN